MTKKQIFVTPSDASGMFVRAGPSKGFKAVESAFPGDNLQLLGDAEKALEKVGQDGQWVQVKTPEGRVGWAAAWLVEKVVSGEESSIGVTTLSPDDTVPVPAQAPGQILALSTVLPGGMNIRSGPSLDYSIVASAEAGDKLVALGKHAEALDKLGKQDEWVPVRTSQDTSGWAAAWLLEKWSPEAPPKEEPAYIKSPIGHALAGIHGPADPGKWPWDVGAYDIVKQARMEAVKLLAAADIDEDVVHNLQNLGVNFIMARLFAKFEKPRSAQSFVDEVSGATQKLYDAGVRYFEVHNEPNLHHKDGPEGMWVNWQNGREFGDFLLECLSSLRTRFPTGKFGWPGLSPGDDVNDEQGKPLRYSSAQFLDEAEVAAGQCDFVCMHTYWQADGYSRSLNEIREYCKRFPGKTIVVSEFSNSSPTIKKSVKGAEYKEFYQAAKALPPNLGALISYVMSASWGYTPEAWRDSEIMGIVAKRK